MTLHLLYRQTDAEAWETRLQPALAAAELTEVVPLALADGPPDWPDLPAESVLLTWLDDADLRLLLPVAVDRSWSLALLPHPGLRHARYGLGVAAHLEEAIADIQAADKAVAVDVLTCNDEPVFRSVVFGEVLTLAAAQPWKQKLLARLRHFWRLVRHMGELRFKPVKLTTAKGRVIDTATLGMVVVEHDYGSLLARRLVGDASTNDGMLHMLLLAPRSVWAVLRFLFLSLFLRNFWNDNTPDGIGHVRTSAVTVSSARPLTFVRDEMMASASEVRLQIQPSALRLLPGRHLALADGGPELREEVRTQTLPAGDAVALLAAHPLPWIHHAGSDEFRELFTTLRDNARASPTYLTLMVLSTLLATVGLFANAVPVIIGAMILAPLMGPIMSLSLGALRQDEKLMLDSARTIGIGTALAMSFAMVFAWLMPLTTLNSEIAARISPTLLDLAVAVISGIAGAYAHARAEVAKSLAGVAIAVALVPPLAVAGIGLGWLSWTVFWGAFLLFLTNLVGIVLAGLLTFMVLGYSPFSRAKRGLALSLGLSALVAVPLALGFVRMVDEHRIVQRLEGARVGEVEVRDVLLRPGKPLRVSMTLVSREAIDDDRIQSVKHWVEAQAGRDVELEVGVKRIR